MGAALSVARVWSVGERWVGCAAAVAVAVSAVGSAVVSACVKALVRLWSAFAMAACDRRA